MPGQAGKTLTLAYPYGSEPFYLRHLSASQRRSSERIRNIELQLHYLSWNDLLPRGRAEEWNLLRPDRAGASWLGSIPTVALSCRFTLRLFQTSRWSQVPSSTAF